VTESVPDSEPVAWQDCVELQAIELALEKQPAAQLVVTLEHQELVAIGALLAHQAGIGVRPGQGQGLGKSSGGAHDKRM
jgi:hypothetical protein